MCECAQCRLHPSVNEIRRQEADTLRYEQALARDEARRNATPQPALAKPEIRGCVFAKSRRSTYPFALHSPALIQT
jgi:hypothetical protein